METSAPENRLVPSISSAAPLHAIEPEFSSKNEGPEVSAGFDFTFVKEAIGWTEAPQKVCKYFPNSKQTRILSFH